MPLTLTRYDVIPGMELMFEAGVELARTFFAATAGYDRLTLERSLSSPGRYWLLVTWLDRTDEQAAQEAVQTLLDELLTDCIAAAPLVEKCATVLEGSADDEAPQDAARNEGLDLYRYVSRPVKPFDTQRRPDAAPDAKQARLLPAKEEKPAKKKPKTSTPVRRRRTSS